MCELSFLYRVLLIFGSAPAPLFAWMWVNTPGISQQIHLEEEEEFFGIFQESFTHPRITDVPYSCGNMTNTTVSGQHHLLFLTTDIYAFFVNIHNIPLLHNYNSPSTKTIKCLLQLVSHEK